MRAVKWHMYEPCNILPPSAIAVAALAFLSSGDRFWPFYFTPGLNRCGHKTPAAPCLLCAKRPIYEQRGSVLV